MDGQTRTIEITYTRSDLGTALDPALFAFTPPADAYLIDDARQPIAKPVTIGSASPPLKLKDKSGVAFDLSDLKGKVALVHFWASWCGACLEEMKTLTQLPQSYAEKGLVIVAVDEDEAAERGDCYFSSQKCGGICTMPVRRAAGLGVQPDTPFSLSWIAMARWLGRTWARAKGSWTR
ncbi:MAG: TlpA disulfide reductase family protein [Candidatus Sulfotelmatobacter sp.]